MAGNNLLLAGCRQCVFMAKDTFAMDEALGSARVRTQWGDSEPRIKVLTVPHMLQNYPL